MYFQISLLHLIFIISITEGAFVIRKEDHRMQNRKYYMNFAEKPKCRPLTIPACASLGYNSTLIPTDLYLTQVTSFTVHKYVDYLRQTSCSKDLLFLLCTTFNPLCFKDFHPPVKPCRSVCQKVKSDCQATLEKFQIKWPSGLNCDDLPNYQTDVCITPDALVPKNHDFHASGNTKVTPTYHCSPCRPPKKLRKFRQFVKADYAIEARFISKTKTFDGRIKLQFEIQSVYKSGTIGKYVINNDIIEIWQESQCSCHNLEYDQVYFILGRQRKRVSLQYMRLTRKTIIVPKDENLTKKLIRWTQVYSILNNKS